MPRRLPIALLFVAAATLAGLAAGLLLDPDRRWWAGVAGGAALLLASGVPTALARRRSRALVDGVDAQRVSGLPLVAHVAPAGAGDVDRRRADEAFRMLRAALVPGVLGGAAGGFAGAAEAPLPGGAAGPGAGGAAAAGARGPADHGAAVAAASTVAVVVTSAAPGEGKTTVAAGLARALARAGRPVIAVEADLRRPALAAALGVEGAAERGLTAAIVGGVPVADLLVDAGPGLRLLPAGELPPNAPELLGGADAARVLAELRALGVDVVLDTAPLLPVADTRELLGQAPDHRVVLVARPGVADRDELRAAVRLLPPATPAVLAVSGRARSPRSYDRYLRDGERA